MRIFASLFALFSLCASAVTAPNFVLAHPQLPGSLQDLQGKVVYLDFWASWCKPCVNSFPFMNQLQQDYAAKGLVIVAVNVDANQADADQFLKQLPATFPVVFDPQGEIAGKYQLPGMPTSYLIDTQGNIRFAHKGFLQSKQADYRREIETLLAEESSDAQ